MNRHANRHPFNAISVCSGIGGLDLAVERVFGARVVALLEREAYAQAVLLDRMEEKALVPAPIFFDVTRFDGKQFRGMVDLVFGGIPCQAHSVAGKQLRSADERDLIDEFLRIVGEVGPRLVFVENVRGFVAGDGLGRLLGGLADLGFDAEWETVQAAQVGAPHKRERVFVLAYSHEGRLSLDGSGGLLDGERQALGHDPDGCDAAVADAQRSPTERRGEPGELRGASSGAQGEGDQRQRGGSAAHASGKNLADAEDYGHQWSGSSRGRRAGSANDSEPLGHPSGPRLEDRQPGLLPQSFPATWPPSPAGEWGEVPQWGWPALANAALEREGAAGLERETRGTAEGHAPESVLRGVADGPSSLLDAAQQHRVDRLRCLGNAVVPQQAEAALRMLLRRGREAR